MDIKSKTPLSLSDLSVLAHGHPDRSASTSSQDGSGGSGLSMGAGVSALSGLGGYVGLGGKAVNPVGTALMDGESLIGHQGEN